MSYMQLRYQNKDHFRIVTKMHKVINLKCSNKILILGENNLYSKLEI